MHHYDNTNNPAHWTHLGQNMTQDRQVFLQLGMGKQKFIMEISLLTKSGTHIQITVMIDTQQQYIKLNIRGEISIIVVQAHSSRKRDICT